MALVKGLREARAFHFCGPSLGGMEKRKVTEGGVRGAGEGGRWMANELEARGNNH